jgi:hypothetical protein
VEKAAEDGTHPGQGGMTVGLGVAADEVGAVPAPRRPRRSAEARPSGRGGGG